MSLKQALFHILGIIVTECAIAQPSALQFTDTLPGKNDSLEYSPIEAKPFDSVKGSLLLTKPAGLQIPKIDSGKLRNVLRKPEVQYSVPRLSLKTPLRFHGGQVAYNFAYRSHIDTPFTDKNIAQHNIIGNIGITAFTALPLNVSFFIRRSNSSLFANIQDVRVEFNAALYAQRIKNAYRKKLESSIPAVRDSMINKLRQFNETELSKLMGKINDPDFQQRLVECNEIIRIPDIAESKAGAAKADSVRQHAREFIESYRTLKGKEQQYRRAVDSLQKEIINAVKSGKTVKDATQSNYTSGSPAEYLSLLKQQGINFPAGLKHLLSVRRFSVGRSPLNYSELTARNVSLNGINMEYNSWFYVAFAAGTVDYRFRDFILNRSNRKPQYLYLARLGLGRLERNFIILSAYKGKKQSYIQQNTSTNSRSLDIYGISAEVKYRLNANNYIIAEIAESTSAGFNVYNEQKSSNLFNWKDKTNKAYSVKLYSFLPFTKTRTEFFYRYNGAFFQSFDRFQSNSSQQYWYVKAEQYLWKRQLRINASLRSNEFSNPYITQQYSGNMIFKTLQFTFRRKKWPVISAGYVPSSQITRVNDQLTENRFHSLNMLAWHQYKLGIQKLATTITYNQFYNGATDSNFIYFNAVSFYLQQHIFFKRFTATLGLSHSRNTGFELNVLEESFQFNLFKNGNLSGGIRVNNYQKQETKLGSWIRVGWRFMKTGWIQTGLDNGFIPTNKNTLVSNKQYNVSISKTF